MGLLLQQFYQQCRFLPWGLGIAGVATTSRQHQWASGNELLQQINTLSSYNQQPASSSCLQAHGFQTIVCVPLQRIAGVLEIGTIELVPESDGMLSEVLQWISNNGLAMETQLGKGSWSMTSAGRLPFDDVMARPFGVSDKDYTKLGYASAGMQIYGSKFTRQPSQSSSYHSSSSPTNSSSPSLEQMPINITTSMLSPTSAHSSFTSNEEMLIIPSNSLEVAPMGMVTSFGQLDILNQMGFIDATLNSSVSVPSLSFGVYDDVRDPAPSDLDYDQPHLSLDSLTFDSFSIDNVDALSAPPCSSSENTFLAEHKSQQRAIGSDLPLSHPLVFESIAQPLQGAGNKSGHILDSQVNADANLFGADLITSPTHQYIAAANHESEYDTLSAHYNSTVRSTKGKVVPNDILLNLAEFNNKKWIKREKNDINQPLGGLLHQGIRPNHAKVTRKDPKGRLMSAFFSWTKLKKPNNPNSSTNRYNVKQILRFHLPRIADRMKAEVAVAHTADYMFLRRRLSAPITIQQQLAEADKHMGSPNSHNNNIIVNAAQQNKTAVKHHMFAERTRRRKQGDCLGILRTLVPSITKRDKVTILESTIDYIKEMQSLQDDLQQQKTSLRSKINAKDMMGSSQSSQDSASLLKGFIDTPNYLVAHATCEYNHSSKDKHVLPYFELALSTKPKDEEVNVSIINLIEVLQQKGLQCIDVKMEFHQSTKNLCARILAHHKDAKNYTPTLEEIQDIKEWWAKHADRISK